MAQIGLIADIHVQPGEEEEVYECFEEVLDSLSEVDHLVLMGDLIGSGSVGNYEDTPAASAEMMSQIVQRAKAAAPPTTFLIGNHEVTDLSTERVTEILGQEAYGQFDVGGEEAIVLDTSAPRLHGSRGEITDEQLDFLEDTLPDVEDALLFNHHPIHYHNVEDNVWWDVYPERAFCGNKKEINHIIDQHGGVRAVFNAHLHEHDHTVFNGLDHVTVEPFSRKRSGEGPTGAHAVVDTDDGITVRVRDFNGPIVEYNIA
ncbi:MAG: hypothetical protein SVW02_00675 [Candidatus Nanohaloarchaea archaeon]|nr:hypothetical protein [Candidatus Nanohaloarchaea archaeon]